VSDHTLVTIELGYGLVHLVDEKRGSPLVARITGVRKQLSQACGFIVPQFRVRDRSNFRPTNIASCSAGCGSAARSPVPIASSPSMGRSAPRPRACRRSDPRPSFGCPRCGSIRPADHAIAEGFLTVDAGTVIATHLNQLLGERPQAMLGPDEVRDPRRVRQRSAGLVETIHQSAFARALTHLPRLARRRRQHRPPLPILAALGKRFSRRPITTGWSIWSVPNSAR
jgi:flagellar biosynthesis protein FlhA